MTRYRYLLLLAVCVGCLSLWTGLQLPNRPIAALAQQTTPVETPQKPVVMDLESTAIWLSLGHKDKQPSAWSGDVEISEGQLLRATVLRKGMGDQVNTNANKVTFQVRTRASRAGRRRVISPNGLLLSLRAPSTARIRVATNQGEFRFRLSDLESSGRVVRLQQQAQAERVANVTQLAGTNNEEVFPAASSGPDGTVYAVYLEHAHVGSPDLNPMPTEPKGFDRFRPGGGGDRLILKRFDGRQWSSALPVTDRELDLWRPTVAVTGQGTVWVVWSQNVGGNWDLFGRAYDTAADKWSAPAQRLTRASGADVNVVATRAHSGTVWLAWQAWRDASFDIHVATLDTNGLAEKGQLGTPQANEWSPAIAADRQGRVHVAYDSYQAGNFDVRLATFDESVRPTESVKSRPIAQTARFEARPSVVCDDRDRVWIAWEERAAGWGKDDWGAVHPGPGSALYRGGSEVRIACLAADGKLLRPQGELFANLSRPQLKRMNSYPRLGVDRTGRLWLSIRHRGQRRGPMGTFWQSFLMSYEGEQWSPPTLLTHSDNLLDNRPQLLGLADGKLLIVYCGDGRDRSTQRSQVNNQVYAAVVKHEAKPDTPQLATWPDATDDASANVHPQETEDIRRMREFRFELAGKTYRLMRGEFHRHTEISRDGGGDGSLQDMWRYALDAAGMDWFGNGDHDNGGGREYTWWITQKTTDIFHHAPHFVPMFTYERSVRYPDGHRNVMFATRGIRALPRLQPQDGENKPNNVSAGDTPMLYRYLKHFDGICAVHTSATSMGTDWRDNDPQVEPIVEIYQGDRNNYEHQGAPRSATKESQIGGFEEAGFIWNALAKGYKLGFQASSDHISTHISYAVAVVEEPSRKGVLDAFKKRHCYGATDNIIAIVTCQDHLMGDEFTTSAKPTLQVNAMGTQPIARVSVIKDMKYVYTTAPNKRQAKFRWTDNAPTPGKTSFYYVRFEQDDGQIAWASPMWITYQDAER